MQENKRKIGKSGEDIAIRFLSSNNAYVIDKNFYFRGGEIDIIARDCFNGIWYLCFIEVKYRRSLKNGYPEEAVTANKQKKIIKGSLVYMNYRKFPLGTPVRYDVISITGDSINWIKNAFTN